MGAFWYYILYAQGSWGEMLEEGSCKGQNRQAEDEVRGKKRRQLERGITFTEPL